MPRILYDRFGFDRFGYNKDGYDRMGYNREGFDRDGYDRNGLNRQGFNKLTGFDKDGYDKDGYDRDGFNRSGFDKDGFDHNGYNTLGYDRTGFNRAGLDKDGYNRQGYDKSGYNRQGYNKDGFNQYGYDKDGFNARGYDIEGFDRSGFNGAGFDRNGFDRNGYDKDGYNRNGFDHNGMDREGYGADGFDLYGFDRDGNDQNGFSFTGWNSDEKNILGFYRDGFNSEGLSIEGYSRELFDVDGYHIYTGFNLKGFDRDGYNVNGLDSDGYDREGYHFITGLNHAGYDRNGYNFYGFDQNGYNRNGYNRDGYDENGFDVYGYDKAGFDRAGYNCDGYDHDGYNFEGYNAEGELKPSLRKNMQLTSDAQQEKLERQYLTKCQVAVRRIYGKQVENEIMQYFKPETSYYYDSRSGLLQTRRSEPDMELARRQIDRKVNRVIRKPYFCHVDYKYNAELYLGKQQVAGWITDWADEQASLYYQWQMYIGNEDKKLELVRDVHISDGDYQGYTDLYNAHQKETKSNTVADQHLAQIIAANQKNKKIHDIVESIQQNQYRIITSNMDTPLLVLGCAGSGKTMILMHKIRYMKYNHKDLQMEDIIVLSPTDILGRESQELSRLLQIEAVKQFTVVSFYETASKQLLNKLQLPYEEFQVIDDGITPKAYYQKTYLDTLRLDLFNILHRGSSDCGSLKSYQEQLDEIVHSYVEQSTLKPEKFGQLNSLYAASLKEIERASVQDLEHLDSMLEKRISERPRYENAQLLIRLLLRGDLLKDVPQLQNYENSCFEQKFFYTLKVSASIISDEFNRGMTHQEFTPTSMAQCLQVLQLFLTENLKRDDARKLLNEWKKVSRQEAVAFDGFLDQQAMYFDHLEYKKIILENLLSEKIVCRKKSIGDTFDYETSFEKLVQLYEESEDALDEVGLTPFTFFSTYNKMLREKKRLQQQRKSPDKNTYLLDSILHLLNVTISYDSITEIPLSKAFLMTELLSSYAGDLSLDKKYIFVDEFQDLSPNELRLVQKLYPNSVFNLFGDLSQCISEKGISELASIPKDLRIGTPATISENYRNARQITEYVNREFSMEMLAVGLNGKQKRVDMIPDLEIAQDDRVAIIVSGAPLILNDFLCDHDVVFFDEQREIVRGAYNVISVANVKGLEFEKAIVVLSGMTLNEQYVACTRAIQELYVIPS